MFNDVMQLLEHLREHKVRLWRENGKLRFKADREVMTPELMAALKQLKPKLLLLLEGGEAAVGEADPGGRMTQRFQIPIIPREQGPFKPVPSQLRMWNRTRVKGNENIYNMGSAIRLAGELAVHAVSNAYTEIERRHESLRLRFFEENGQVVMCARAPCRRPLALVDLSGLPQGQAMELARSLAGGYLTSAFDLGAGMLMKTLLMRIQPQDHALALNVHHIASDGWSQGVMAAEFAQLYNAFVRGRPSPLPEPTVQYIDYAVWLNQRLASEEVQQQLGFWLDLLRGSPVDLHLPTRSSDKPAPAQAGESVVFVVESQLLERVKTAALEAHATLFMMFQLALAMVLSLYSRQDEVLVATPIVKREHKQLEPMIGLFLNGLVLRNRFSGDLSLRELLHNTVAMNMDAFARTDVPMDAVMTALAASVAPDPAPNFRVMFTMQNFEKGGFELSGLQLKPLAADNPIVKYNISFIVEEMQGAAVCTLLYKAALYEREMMERMGGHVVQLLTALVESPRQRLAGFRGVISPD